MGLVSLAPQSVLPLIQKASADVTRRLFEVLQEFNKRDSFGGYLCLANPQTGVPYLLLGMGEVWPDKQQKYFEICQEKAIRLASYPDHFSSAQSRCDSEGKYPGAIRTKDMIFSFSGLPWELDECFTLLLAVCFGCLDKERAADIAALSGNTRFKAVSEQVCI